MFQAHFVAAPSRNKSWSGKQPAKLFGECAIQATLPVIGASTQALLPGRLSLRLSKLLWWHRPDR